MDRIIRVSVCFVIVLMAFGLPSNVQAATTVGGPILSDTVWNASGSPYHVTSNLNVLTGVTLTIQSGVTLKFDPGFKLLVNGALVVEGSADAPVIFTSSQLTPAPGDWDKIEFSATSVSSTVGLGGGYLGGSILRNCVVEYGGSGEVHNVPGPAVLLQGTLMENCTVRYSNRTGVKAVANGSNPSWITQSTITNNRPGVELNHSFLTNSLIANNETVIYGTNAAGVVAGNQSQVIDNIIENNHSRSTDNCPGGILMTGGILTGNIIRTNQGNIGAGLNISGSIDNPATVSKNYIHDNLSGARGGGVQISGSAVIFQNNVVEHNQVSTTSLLGCYGGGIILYGNNTLTSNTIINNQLSCSNAHGSGIFAYYNISPSTLSKNTIVGNSNSVENSIAGGFETSGSPLFNDNTLYGNFPYNATVTGTNDVEGTQNYWGTPNLTDLPGLIWDFYDSSSLGEFLFFPFRSAPEPAAPLAPPLNVSGQILIDESLQLSWDGLPSFAINSTQTKAISSSGYKVYYDDDGQPPFDGKGSPAGESPVDAGAATSILFAAPLPQFVAITAYDADGNESWYSSVIQVATNTDTYKIFVPAIQR